VISCWHEIPLWAGEDELHFICEIPKETSAKMEVATVSELAFHPLNFFP
jgi:inorganic pyrophosphatase